jgi:hypothetical protein
MIVLASVVVPCVFASLWRACLAYKQLQLQLLLSGKKDSHAVWVSSVLAWSSFMSVPFFLSLPLSSV